LRVDWVIWSRLLDILFFFAYSSWWDANWNGMSTSNEWTTHDLFPSVTVCFVIEYTLFRFFKNQGWEAHERLVHTSTPVNIREIICHTYNMPIQVNQKVTFWILVLENLGIWLNDLLWTY
jgi:hypothetical protein